MSKFKIRNGIITIVALVLVLLLIMPTILVSNSSVTQSALAQTESTLPPGPSNDTSGIQGEQEVRLPSQEGGFSVQVLATSFSAP
jgi:hypothetical protein